MLFLCDFASGKQKRNYTDKDYEQVRRLFVVTYTHSQEIPIINTTSTFGDIVAFSQ